MNIKEEALNIINLIEVRREQYDKINDSIKEMQPDFPAYLHYMDDTMEGALVSLLDNILDGGDIASYYLYECIKVSGTNSREIIEDGKTWPLTNIVELAAFVNRKGKA